MPHRPKSRKLIGNWLRSTIPMSVKEMTNNSNSLTLRIRHWKTRIKGDYTIWAWPIRVLVLRLMQLLHRMNNQVAMVGRNITRIDGMRERSQTTTTYVTNITSLWSRMLKKVHEIWFSLGISYCQDASDGDLLLRLSRHDIQNASEWWRNWEK